MRSLSLLFDVLCGYGFCEGGFGRAQWQTLVKTMADFAKGGEDGFGFRLGGPRM